jgi:hypothetical protein
MDQRGAQVIGLQKRVAAVKCRKHQQKRDMKLNIALPRIDVDPETYVVKADGQILTHVIRWRCFRCPTLFPVLTAAESAVSFVLALNASSRHAPYGEELSWQLGVEWVRTGTPPVRSSARPCWTTF